jgi:hypothetical protein
MHRRHTWAYQNRRKVGSGLLIGFAVLVMVAVELLPSKYSMIITVMSLCIIFLGGIVLFIDYLARQESRQ